MFSRNSSIALRHARNARFMATEASEVAASESSADSGKMQNLLEKLASITSNGSTVQKQTMMKKSNNRDGKFRGSEKENKENRKSKPYKKDASNANYKRNNNNNNNNNNRSRERVNNNTRRGFNNRNERSTQTVSHFDRFKNPKKSLNSSKTSSTSSLNADGLSFADLEEARALYIRRKVENKQTILASTSEERVFNFVHSRAVHKSQIYDLKNEKFASFKELPNIYRLEGVKKSDLELTKDKLGYDTKSRILRALEQLTTKRGFKLIDSEKKNFKYLPYNSMLYPYGNTTLPNNLDRPTANLKFINNIPKEEIDATIASVVKGTRQELIFDPKFQFKTQKLKVNAQVVVNGLNRNAQLQVDNLHKSMAQVMLGEKPVNALPQPILAPKKL